MRRAAHIIIVIVALLSFYPDVLNYEMMAYLDSLHDSVWGRQSV